MFCEPNEYIDTALEKDLVRAENFFDEDARVL